MSYLHYKLNDRPFDLGPDPKYFYASHAQNEVMRRLNDGLEQLDGLFVLVGDKGVGKTTLVNHLLLQRDDSAYVVAFIQQPPQKLRDFLPAILAAFGIDGSELSPNAMFNALQHFLIEQSQQERKIVLAVDDAEELSHNCFELIRLLASMDVGGKALVQIILVGTSVLDEELSSPKNLALKQRISKIYRISALSEYDTREYINHRLRVAGWNGDPEIDADVYSAIHHLTGGVPLEINQICERLFMLGMFRETHRISNKDVADLGLTNMENITKLENAWSELESNKAENEYRFPPKREAEEEQSWGEKEPAFASAYFDNSKRSEAPMFSAQIKVTLAVICLVAVGGVFFFNKKTENHISAVTATGHGGVKEDTVAESAGDGHLGEGLGVLKYVLPASQGGDSTGVKSTEPQMLDIQSLLNREQTVVLNTDTKAIGENEATATKIDEAGVQMNAIPEAFTDAVSDPH